MKISGKVALLLGMGILVMPQIIFAKGAPVLTVGEGTGLQGEEVAVEIVLTEPEALKTIEFKLDYDTSVLSLSNEKCIPGQAFSDWMYLQNVENTAGRVNIAAVSTKGFSSDERVTVCTLNFKIKEGANAEKVQIALQGLGSYYDENTPAPIKGVNGAVTIIKAEDPVNPGGGSGSGSGGGNSGTGNTNKPNTGTTNQGNGNTTKPGLTGNQALIKPGNLDKLTDISNHWAKVDIEKVVSLGYMVGKTETTFCPNEVLTRGEMATILNRFVESSSMESLPFTDILGNEWYTPSIRNMYHVGLISGYEDNTFRPKASIKRIEVMAIITRLMAYHNVEVTVQNPEQLLSRYKDAQSIPSWAKNEAAWCVGQGIIGGDAKGQLNGNAYITRAELAAIISRILNN